MYDAPEDEITGTILEICEIEVYGMFKYEKKIYILLLTLFFLLIDIVNTSAYYILKVLLAHLNRRFK